MLIDDWSTRGTEPSVVNNWREGQEGKWPAKHAHGPLPVSPMKPEEGQREIREAGGGGWQRRVELVQPFCRECQMKSSLSWPLPRQRERERNVSVCVYTTTNILLPSITGWMLSLLIRCRLSWDTPPTSSSRDWHGFRHPSGEKANHQNGNLFFFRSGINNNNLPRRFVVVESWNSFIPNELQRIWVECVTLRGPWKKKRDVKRRGGGGGETFYLLVGKF